MSSLVKFDSSETVIRLTGVPITFEFQCESGESEEAGEFDIEHTGEYGGKPDEFCWTYVTPLSLQNLSEEKEKELHGKILPSLLFNFRPGDKFQYRPLHAKFLRIRPLSEIAKKMGVIVDVG